MSSSPEGKRAYAHRRYLEAKAAGLCVICGRGAVAGETRCKLCKDRQKAHYQATRDERLAFNRRYWVTLTPQERAVQIARRSERRRLQRVRVLAHYGTQCACRSESHPDFLTVDHVDGGGNAHRRELTAGRRNSARIYGWLERNGFPPGFQLLCWNCNMAKGLYGSCPHVRGMGRDG